MHQTKQSIQYTLICYKLWLYHSRDKYYDYSDRYEEITTVHSGCFKVDFKVKFNTRKKLIEYLRKYYPKYSSAYFYNNINDSVKEQKDKWAEYRIIIQTNKKIEGQYFELHKKRKRHPKKRSWQWDDMWNSDGAYSKHVIMKRDFNNFHDIS
jgi:hypothetical protein